MLCYFRTRSTELEGQTRKRYTLHCFLLPPPHILTAQNGVSGRFGGSWSPSCRKKRALPKCSLGSPLLSMVLNAIPKSIPIRLFIFLHHAHKPLNISLYATSHSFMGCLTHTHPMHTKLLHIHWPSTPKTFALSTDPLKSSRCAFLPSPSLSSTQKCGGWGQPCLLAEMLPFLLANLGSTQRSPLLMSTPSSFSSWPNSDSTGLSQNQP